MKISIVIPTYNDECNLNECLSAISKSSYKPYEVIVVDDASTDRTKEVVNRFGHQYIRLKNNSGQAVARNTGAKTATGDMLFFIDSDIKIRDNTIEKIVQAYKNPEIVFYQGIPSKTPLNKGFGPELAALKCYYAIYKIRNASFVYSLVFSIRKAAFDEIGGFDERFKPPGCGEEFELGHRLRKKYILHTDPELLVDHNCRNILQRAYVLYKRSFVWAELFLKTTKFEKTIASIKESLGGLSGLLSVLFLICSVLHIFFFYLLILFFIIHVTCYVDFYLFLLKEKGAFFALKSILPNMLWSIMQVLGGIKYYVKKALRLAA